MSHFIMKTSNSKKTITQEITGTVSEIIIQVKKLIKEGNARRVMIQNKDGKILFQSQLTVGLAGTVALTVISPFVAAIGTFALFMNDVKVIVERYPDEERDEYEVEAEVIEIRDDEESDDDADDEDDKKTDKTVGKQ
ncbi:MAG TPA: DUF4342 domain-containing protein [Balneolaceae bacterium]|nr:DUF4342 domain-containing protein [Balneolaceae bacterium]